MPWKNFRNTQRKVCSLGEDYAYSGQVTKGYPLDLYPPVVKMAERFSELTGMNYNGVLFNWYPAGTVVGIGKHSDDESKLRGRQPIVSVSLGQTVNFILQAKRGDEQLIIPLEDGHVFIMGQDCQRYYFHSCPYVKMKTDRISLTFREFFISE